MNHSRTIIDFQKASVDITDEQINCVRVMKGYLPAANH